MFVFSRRRMMAALTYLPFFVASFLLPAYAKDIVTFLGGKYIVALAIYLFSYASMLLSFMVPILFLKARFYPAAFLLFVVISVTLMVDYSAHIRPLVRDLDYVTDNLEMKRGIIEV